MKVGVIGAGAAGLVAARELEREGHKVVIYEKAKQLGGIWVYDPRVETDPLGVDPNRDIIHTSLYLSLRTNLPRELMGFSDYPFHDTQNGDARIFPRHEEVLKFLENFAADFGLTELIRFNTEVVRVEQVNNGWVVESRASGDSFTSEEMFEAVLVCNGHHTQPRVPNNLPGIDKWPGKQVHSHNYRIPEPFRGQVVVMIGSGPSAYDISREIATFAKEVHLSSRAPDVNVSKFPNYDNIWQHSEINCVYEDGTIAFKDGYSLVADIIFHCTGYKYYFPFLETNGFVSVEDNRVGPLYKHIFPPRLAPFLSFVGLPQRTIAFRMLELQSKWIAQVLSSKLLLPSEEDMIADVNAFYQHMEECGIPKHHTHSPNIFQFEYMDWLADQVGEFVDERLKEIFKQLLNYVLTQVDGFRDEWAFNNTHI